MGSRAGSEGGGAADAAKRSLNSPKSARSAANTVPSSTAQKKSSQSNGPTLRRKLSRFGYVFLKLLFFVGRFDITDSLRRRAQEKLK